MGIISGGGGGGAAFNGGTITTRLAIAPTATTADALDITLPAGYARDAFKVADISSGQNVVEFDNQGDFFLRSGAGSAVLQVNNQSVTPQLILDSNNGYIATDGSGNAAVQLGDGVLRTNPPVPATVALVSGAGVALSSTIDVRTYTPVTFNPTAGAAATCAVAVSRDGTNYIALWTETEPAGIAFDGTIHGINVYVPTGWKLRLTVVNATIGTTTYY